MSSAASGDQRQVPLIHEDPTAAAFFDLDNTVVQGASLFHLAKGLYRRGFFPTRVILKGLWLQAYFRMVGREKPAISRMPAARPWASSKATRSPR